MGRTAAIVVALTLACLTGHAAAQCTGGLIVNCPPVVNLQPTDVLPVWQLGQNPHSRAATLSTLLGGGGTLPGNFSTLAVTNNTTVGGTLGVAGATTLLGTQTLGAGAAFRQPFTLYGALSGVPTGGADAIGTYSQAIIGTSSDTLAAGAPGLTGLVVNMYGGGTGATGNRLGIYSNLNFTGTGGVVTASSMYSPLWAYGYVSGNVGGTSGSTVGALWGGAISAELNSGATYFSSVIGLEIDVAVHTGASATYVQGAKIVLQNHNQATNLSDYMLGFTEASASTSVQIGKGISFGSPDGWWPIATTGTIIGTTASNIGGGPAYAAAYGVDFSAVTFGAAAFKSNGFTVDGSGVITAAANPVFGIAAGVNVLLLKGGNTVSGDGPKINFQTPAGNVASIGTYGSIYGGTTATLALYAGGNGIAMVSDGLTVGFASNKGVGTINAAGAYYANGTAGFTGTKTAGSCSIAVTGGIVTNITGC